MFDETESQFDHFGGRIVEFNNTLIAIGGENNAQVEKLEEKIWTGHPEMSPVGELVNLADFSTLLSTGGNLYIFGELKLKKMQLRPNSLQVVRERPLWTILWKANWVRLY